MYLMSVRMYVCTYYKQNCDNLAKKLFCGPVI